MQKKGFYHDSHYHLSDTLKRIKVLQHAQHRKHKIIITRNSLLKHTFLYSLTKQVFGITKNDAACLSNYCLHAAHLSITFWIIKEPIIFKG